MSNKNIKNKEKPLENFEKILGFMKIVDKASGLFQFRENNHLSKTDRFLQVFCPLFVIEILVFAISSPFVCRYQKATIIVLTISNLQTCFACFYIRYKLSHDHHLFKKLLKWCQKVDDISKNFHPVLHDFAFKKFNQVTKNSYNFTKGIVIGFTADAFCVTILFAIVGTLLPESIHPKFSPPLPYYLPFKNQESWFTFITTVLFQFKCSYMVGVLAAYSMSILVTTSMHIFGYLDVIVHSLGMLKTQLTEREKNFIYECKVKEITVENESSHQDLSVLQWFGLIHTMYVDALR